MTRATPAAQRYRDLILAHLSSHPDQQFTGFELTRVLTGTTSSKTAFRSALNALLAEGAVSRSEVRDGTFRIYWRIASGS